MRWRDGYGKEKRSWGNFKYFNINYSLIVRVLIIRGIKVRSWVGVRLKGF